MAASHDRAANRIAKKMGGSYEPAHSPDVKWKGGCVEVKSSANEITKALRQLSGCRGPSYVALPRKEHPAAIERLDGRKTGLMDHHGNIVKKSTRVRR